MRAKQNKKDVAARIYSAAEFDKLWDSSYEEVENFIKTQRKTSPDSDKSALKLLKEELKSRDFEIQKLLWQLGEREKELGSLYQELNAQIELSEKLNEQLEKYQKLLRIIA